ncbi:hypothetical protein HDU99_007579 [Rhizoclosmatium hyalinum]|nr:hypothetical protein HDU99_007579 [Rhizoclosmatium hyalinum]
MKGYLNLNKMANGPKIGSLLDDALERVPGGGIFEIQFNPQMYVRFRVCKKLVGSTPTNATYVARQLKTGMFAKRPTEDEEQELEDDDEENDEEDEDEGQSSVKRQFLLQVSNPPSSWSFYVLETLRFRLPERTLLSIPTPTSCHLFRDVSCLRTEYSTEMTLFDAISLSAKHSYGLGSASSQKEGGIEELLTCFWAIELLRTIESIHMSGFLHGSISPLSILIRLGRVKTMTGADGFWDPQYDPAGFGGWNAQGVMVGGFSEGVDLFAFPEDQRFLFEKTGARGCWEVMNGLACKYEVDWFGVAEVVHWMLFGKELAVIYEENGDGGRPIGRVGSQWKRYWQVEMWERLFDVLLNLEKASFSVPSNIGGKDEEFADFAREFPPALLIRGVRIEMEKWLVGSCSKAGKSLKSLLQRVEMASLSMM